MVYSGAWGKMIHEKNQKQKILWHSPFKWLELWLKLIYIASCVLNISLYVFIIKAGMFFVLFLDWVVIISGKKVILNDGVKNKFESSNIYLA